MPNGSKENQADVLIVGAGPSGLMMACQLARRGISFRIIDKKDHSALYSGALIVQARTIEMFQQLGIAKKAIQNGVIANEIKLIFNGKKSFFIPVKNIGEDLSPYPNLLMLEQSKTEQLLSDYIQDFGYKVEMETEFVQSTRNDEGVSSLVKYVNGEFGTIKSKYLVAADGAHSPIRKQLEIPFIGKTYSNALFVTDCRAEADLATDQLCFSFSDLTTTGFFPLKGGRWRIDGTLAGELSIKEGITFDDIAADIALNTRMKVKMSDPEWFSVFQSHDRYALTFQKNRYFLVGDAAHIHSPVGAQGMNTGMQDSCNLAWKLALVIQGKAKVNLLDTYSSERIVVAKKVVHGTDHAFKLVTGRSRLVKNFRVHLLPFLVKLFLPCFVKVQAIRHFFFRRISEIGIQYRESPLSYQASSGNFRAHSPRPGDRLPFLCYPENGTVVNIQEKVEGTDYCLFIFSKSAIPESIKKVAEKYAHFIQTVTIPYSSETTELYQRLGITTSGWYLVRPDQYIAYRSNQSDGEHFERYLQQFFI